MPTSLITVGEPRDVPRRQERQFSSTIFHVRSSIIFDDRFVRFDVMRYRARATNKRFVVKTTTTIWWDIISDRYYPLLRTGTFRANVDDGFQRANGSDGRRDDSVELNGFTWNTRQQVTREQKRRSGNVSGGKSNSQLTRTETSVHYYDFWPTCIFVTGREAGKFTKPKWIRLS